LRAEKGAEISHFSWTIAPEESGDRHDRFLVELLVFKLADFFGGPGGTARWLRGHLIPCDLEKVGLISSRIDRAKIRISRD